MNQLPPHVLERINENRLKAIERKRKLEEQRAKDNELHAKQMENVHEAQSKKARKSSKTSDYRKKNKKGDVELLSDEQRAVYDQVMGGKSAFITGCGGTGKSHLMHSVISGLRDKVGKSAVAVTATTGIAATHIGGSSLHSFAGIGIGEGSLQDLVKKVNNNRNARKRWHETKCLIIDEVSMLDAELFDKLEGIAAQVRNSKKPFGGIQLLLVGDFLQLPPVAKNGKQVKFCFESDAWNKCVDVHVELTKVFRQSEKEFVDMLNSIRWGVCTPEITTKLRATMSNKIDGEISATKLYSRNMQVDEINSRSLALLNSQTLKLTASDSGEQPWLDQLKKNCLAPEVLELKVGAQVMLLKNLDTEMGLINGLRGVVIEFRKIEDPEEGRIGTFPVVRFETTSMDEIEVVIYPEDFNVEANGVVIARRTQVPLRLAYAITIHKCQGMTLSKVEMSLKDVFEPGQAYVALSRVSSLDGLRLLDFAPSNVRAHPRVIEFYTKMRNKSDESKRNNGSRVNPLFIDD